MKRRFQTMMLSDLEEGDRFRVSGTAGVFTFDRYSEKEKCWIYKKDGDPKEKMKKNDFAVVFLRNVKQR